MPCDLAVIKNLDYRVNIRLGLGTRGQLNRHLKIVKNTPNETTKYCSANSANKIRQTVSDLNNINNNRSS